MEDMVETIQPYLNLARWRSVEHMVSIIARARCEGQHINGCAGSCRSVFAALSCTWQADTNVSLSGGAALLVGTVVFADKSLQAMCFKRCFLFG